MELKSLFTYHEESRNLYEKFLKVFKLSVGSSSRDSIVFINKDTQLEIEFYFINKWIKYSIRYYDKNKGKMRCVYNYFWNSEYQTQFYFIGGDSDDIDYYIINYVNPHWFCVSLLKFCSVLCSKEVADVIGTNYFIDKYDELDEEKISEDRIILENIGGKYMFCINVLGSSVVEQLKDLGYYCTTDNETLMVFEQEENKAKIVIKQNNGNYTLNFENDKGDKFLKSDWYLGNNDGVCCVDIFTIMQKPEFKKFCECKQEVIDENKDIEDYNKQDEKLNKDCYAVYDDTKEKIKEICDNISDLLIYKNQKYGNSALEPQNIFYKGDTENALLIRLDDKIGRIINNTDGIRVNDVCDIIGYLVLYLVYKNISKQDIEKLKD